MTAVRREEDREVGRDAAGSGASPARQEVSGGDSGGRVERDVRWKVVASRSHGKRPPQEKKRSEGMWVSGLANRWPERATLVTSIPTQRMVDEGKETGGGKGITF